MDWPEPNLHYYVHSCDLKTLTFTATLRQADECWRPHRKLSSQTVPLRQPVDSQPPRATECPWLMGKYVTVGTCEEAMCSQSSRTGNGLMGMIRWIKIELQVLPRLWAHNLCTYVNMNKHLGVGGWICWFRQDCRQLLPCGNVAILLTCKLFSIHTVHRNEPCQNLGTTCNLKTILDWKLHHSQRKINCTAGIWRFRSTRKAMI